MIDIRDIDGLWCDDITFCQETCGWRSCPRNKQNVRDKTIPHSFSVEIPQDCPKKQETVKPQDAEMLIIHNGGAEEYVKDIESIILLAHKDYDIVYCGSFRKVGEG